MRRENDGRRKKAVLMDKKREVEEEDKAERKKKSKQRVYDMVGLNAARAAGRKLRRSAGSKRFPINYHILV